MLLGAVNFFKGTLPHTRSRAAFLDFVHTQPYLARILAKRGIKEAVLQYVRYEICVQDLPKT